MKPVSIRTHLIVALLITSAVPGISGGQDLGIGATLLAANHPLLGDPLGGGRAALRWPRGNGEVEFRIDAEWLHGRAERIGVPCAAIGIWGSR